MPGRLAARILGRQPARNVMAGDRQEPTCLYHRVRTIRLEMLDKQGFSRTIRLEMLDKDSLSTDEWPHLDHAVVI
jgi:hypothetical protein